MPQRKLVDLGRALGRIISMEFTINLGHQGFNKDLINHAIINVQKRLKPL